MVMMSVKIVWVVVRVSVVQYLRISGISYSGIDIGGEENQSKGDDGKDLHCSLFDAEVVVSSSSGDDCLRGLHTPFYTVRSVAHRWKNLAA